MNWDKTTTLIGLILSATGVVLALIVPEVRCFLRIERNCPKGYCNKVFNKAKKIEFKYRRITPPPHIEFGEVENLEIDKINTTKKLVTGEVHLLQHPFDGNTDITQPLTTRGRFPSKNKLTFKIKYDENDKWSLNLIDTSSGSRLEGSGDCENDSIASGEFKYEQHARYRYKLYFQHIP